MIVNRKQHKGKAGIYCIRNLINNKVYIGKSKDIAERIYNHIGRLNAKDKKSENQHFINAWWKYGKDNFEYFILEYIDVNIENFEIVCKEKEMYWMSFYKSTNADFGYNFRMDSSTKMIVHEETKKKLSSALNKRFENKEERDKISKASKKFWKENPEIKEEMKKKVSDNHTKYSIYQYSKDGKILIKIWNKVKDVIKDNPNYKVHNIYAACSGEKPTMYGYKWVKILNDDIVRSE